MSMISHWNKTNMQKKYAAGSLMDSIHSTLILKYKSEWQVGKHINA